MAKTKDSGIGGGGASSTQGVSPISKLSASDFNEAKENVLAIDDFYKQGVIDKAGYDDMMGAVGHSFGLSQDQLEKIKNGEVSSVEDLYKQNSTKAEGNSTKAKASKLSDTDIMAAESWGNYMMGDVNSDPQTKHQKATTISGLMDEMGIHYAQAKEFKNAINQSGVGGFSIGWDSVIRAYQNGASESEILKMNGTMKAINDNFGGDKAKYFNALKQKSDACEALIDAGPKWSGSELTRGFKNLSPDVLSQLTTQGQLVNLNAGTASWSTDQDVAKGFAGIGSGSLIAHCSDQRRGTSIRGLSKFHYEDEVLCSKHEAFVCTKVEQINGRTHAWYDLVSVDYDWGTK